MLVGLSIRCIWVQSLLELGVALVKVAGQSLVPADQRFAELGGGVPHDQEGRGHNRAASAHTLPSAVGVGTHDPNTTGPVKAQSYQPLCIQVHF